MLLEQNLLTDENHTSRQECKAQNNLISCPSDDEDEAQNMLS